MGFCSQQYWCINDILKLSYTLFLYLFILGRPPWPHRIIIIGWWCSKPIIDTTGTLGSVPIFCYNNYISVPCLHLLPEVSSGAAPSPHFSSYPSNAAAALYLAPSKLIPSLSHCRQETQAPSLQTYHSQRSIIGHVAIYCVTVFCPLVM